MQLQASYGRHVAALSSTEYSVTRTRICLLYVQFIAVDKVALPSLPPDQQYAIAILCIVVT